MQLVGRVVVQQVARASGCVSLEVSLAVRIQGVMYTGRAAQRSTAVHLTKGATNYHPVVMVVLSGPRGKG